MLPKFLVEDQRIIVTKYEADMSHLDVAVKITGIIKSEFINTMLVRNKYSNMIIACVMKGGSRVDKRILAQLSIGGTKAWEFVSNEELSSKFSFHEGSVPPLGLSLIVDAILVDPRVMRLKQCSIIAYDQFTLLTFPPDIILEQEKARVAVNSYG